MMSDEQQKTLQKLYLEQRIVTSNIAALQQRLEMVEVYLSNYRTSLSVLEELMNRKEGEDVMLNVGGRILVHARLARVDKVTRDIGSGVRVESSLEDAKTDSQESIGILEKQYEELSQEYRRQSDYAETLNARLQELAAKIRGPGE